MKTFSLIAGVAALVSFAQANTCEGSMCDGCGAFINSWHLQHDGGVDFSEPFCKGFWDNLQCIAPSVRACGNGEDGKGFISFNAGIACNEGDIESAWWRATKNEFGSFDCIYSSKHLPLRNHIHRDYDRRELTSDVD